MFNKYLSLGVWRPERGQAMIFMGDCKKYSGQPKEAEQYYHMALMEDDTRREPFFALGMLHAEQGNYRGAVIYLKAALEIPFNPNYYLNHMSLYTWEIHDQLSLFYDKLGEKEKAKEQYFLTLQAAPEDARILSNARWFCRKD